MTRDEAIKTLKENYCAMCAYGSQDMDSCDIRSCDNKDAIKALEQEPKTGRWIDDKCSVCGKGIDDLIDSHEWYRNEEPSFCPFCGLKLVNSQESNAIPLNNIVKLPKDEVVYGYISKQFPITNVFFDSYETALNSAMHDQPKHRPFYMIKATRHFEFCGIVEKGKVKYD